MGEDRVAVHLENRLALRAKEAAAALGISERNPRQISSRHHGTRKGAAPQPKAKGKPADSNQRTRKDRTLHFVGLALRRELRGRPHVTEETAGFPFDRLYERCLIRPPVNYTFHVKLDAAEEKFEIILREQV
jgi:hypothetical protein